MIHSYMSIFAVIFAALALCGTGYLALSLWSAFRFLRRSRSASGEFTPPVTLLKPLHGSDREMYEALHSHCLQDYPDYEVIFGVSDPNDAAVAEVERLRREFPERNLRLVMCPRVLGTNGKVSNLIQMMAHARHAFILINDSDIHVEPDYLRHVMTPFADEHVGMVTSLYRAHAGRTLASRLEAVIIATDFAGGVLSAIQLEGGLHFALGSTLAIRRKVLEEIGGLEPLVDYLADDYELGDRTSRAGHEVVLADTVVDTHLPDYTFAAMFQHQLRWARTVRDKRHWGYLGVLVTYALPWAILAALFAKGASWSLALLGCVAVLRMMSAWVLCDPVLHDLRTLRDLWLVPLRDVAGVLVWAATYAGNTVTWRGDVFHLKDGRLTRVEPSRLDRFT